MFNDEHILSRHASSKNSIPHKHQEYLPLNYNYYEFDICHTIIYLMGPNK